jgi:hypothetical protein
MSDISSRMMVDATCVQFGTAGLISIRYDKIPAKKTSLPLTAQAPPRDRTFRRIEGTEEGNCMQRLRRERPTQNRVVAVFEASAAFFELPLAATLEDLADRLTFLSERHGGALISVDVRVGS